MVFNNVQTQSGIETLKSERGFTLVELMVVMSIIALLTSVVLMFVFSARVDARDMSRQTDLQQLKLGLRLYKEAHGDYPGLEDGVVVNYSNGIEIGVGGEIDAALRPFLASVKNDPLGETGGGGEYGYYYSSSFSCNGRSIVAVMAKSTEAEKFATANEVCGGDSDFDMVLPVTK